MASRFGVNIIPHTQKVTTFGRAKPGMKVNLEVDLMARYVARLVGSMNVSVFHDYISQIEDVIEDARNGRMFILIDAEDRENEGDLVIPAQMCTPACRELHGEDTAAGSSVWR